MVVTVTMSLGHTLADNDEAAKATTPSRTGPYLFLLIEYERPRAFGTRHSLFELRTVAIGRGSERRATRTDGELQLRVPDRRMSSSHALLTLVRGQWVLEDSGSRNGTRKNGELVEQTTLGDGDVIEMGRSLFLFREGLPPSTLLDLDAAEVTPTPLTLNPSLEHEFERLRRIAASKRLAILVEGESGTGKEVLAQRMFEWSGRTGRFVGVNCGALPENLVESELFGATRGAFSGAVSDRVGLVRSADKGCLFLDEIAELPLASQASLLRVLQEHEVVPVGASRPIPVDLQILAATHQDIEARVANGRFRQDLFARISGFRCRLPALRERKEDLGLIIGTLLARDPNAPIDIHFSSEAVRAMLNYSWPLNIRELSNSLAAAVLLANDGLIDVEHLPKETARTISVPPPPLTEEQTAQREELVSLLTRHEGNVSAIARELGKARMQVQRWLKRYDLDAESFRS